MKIVTFKSCTVSSNLILLRHCNESLCGDFNCLDCCTGICIPFFADFSPQKSTTNQGIPQLSPALIERVNKRDTKANTRQNKTTFFSWFYWIVGYKNLRLYWKTREIISEITFLWTFLHSFQVFNLFVMQLAYGKAENANVFCQLLCSWRFSWILDFGSDK